MPVGVTAFGTYDAIATPDFDLEATGTISAGSVIVVINGDAPGVAAYGVNPPEISDSVGLTWTPRLAATVDALNPARFAIGIHSWEAVAPVALLDLHIFITPVNGPASGAYGNVQVIEIRNPNNSPFQTMDSASAGDGNDPVITSGAALSDSESGIGIVASTMDSSANPSYLTNPPDTGFTQLGFQADQTAHASMTVGYKIFNAVGVNIEATWNTDSAGSDGPSLGTLLMYKFAVGGGGVSGGSIEGQGIEGVSIEG